MGCLNMVMRRKFDDGFQIDGFCFLLLVTFWTMMMMIPHGLTLLFPVGIVDLPLLSKNALEMHSLPLSLYFQSTLRTYENISPLMQSPVRSSKSLSTICSWHYMWHNNKIYLLNQSKESVSWNCITEQRTALVDGEYVGFYPPQHHTFEDTVCVGVFLNAVIPLNWMDRSTQALSTSAVHTNYCQSVCVCPLSNVSHIILSILNLFLSFLTAYNCAGKIHPVEALAQVVVQFLRFFQCSHCLLS